MTSDPYDTSWVEWVMYIGSRVVNGDRDPSDLTKAYRNFKAYLRAS